MLKLTFKRDKPYKKTQKKRVLLKFVFANDIVLISLITNRESRIEIFEKL